MSNSIEYLSFWDDELNSAALYKALTEIEKDKRLAEVYHRMQIVEENHAKKWAGRVKDQGGTLPIFKASFRTRALIWLAKRFGPEVALTSIRSMEQNGTEAYSKQPEATEMMADEKSHAVIINQITRSTAGGFEGGFLAQLEGRHRSTGGNALRAAVLGANDGLTSNLSLVMGVAGAALSNQSIIITGLAGLLAGAISMALGEWLSVQSSRELFSNQIKIEALEIEQSPAEEAEELALIYEARGLSKEQSRILSTQIISNKDHALDTLAREELGVDPKELGGSAWEAAITSFLLFAVGAIIPVYPFFFLTGIPAIIVSIILSLIGLFILEAVITIFTGRTVLYSGLRMMLFGLAAASVTFIIGRLIGVGLGG